MRDNVVRDLERARARTLELTDLDEPALLAQHDPLMSPLVWDLAHIGQQEELWLLRGGDPARPGMLPPDVDSLYDAFKHRRADRPALPLLPPVEARAYDHEVRGRVLDLHRANPRGCSGEPVHRGHGRPARGAARRDHVRHPPAAAGPAGAAAARPLPPGRPIAERALLRGRRPVRARRGRGQRAVLARQRAARARRGRRPVLDRAGAGEPAGSGASSSPTAATSGRTCGPSGAGRTGWRPAWSGPSSGPPRAPAAASGSRRTCRRTSRCSTSATTRPRRSPGGAAPACPPRSSGRRPAPGIPAASARRAWPWGSLAPTPELANLGGAALRPAPVGAYPGSASAYGAEQLIGDVWEWTSSDFRPWPGFTPMIYRAYSEPFFGCDYKVLRGGSWAVAPSTIRPSFRNWDYPIRRQIFTGVRLAWDV